MLPKFQHNLGSVDQIPAGEGRVFLADGVEVAVFHDRSGAVFATQSRCPHLGGPLADGLVGQGKVICPLHERTYNLDSGGCTNCDESLQTYRVELSGSREILLTV